MAEPGPEHPSGPAPAAGAASAAGKRKRVAAQVAPETRPVKRAPPANMSTPTDADSAAHTYESAVDAAAQAAEAAQVAQAAIATTSHSNMPDLSPLQQATASEHQPQHHGHVETSEAANASSTAATAAAALGSMYPAIHMAAPDSQYPPPGADNQHQQENAYPPPPGGEPHGEPVPHVSTEGLLDRNEIASYGGRNHDGRGPPKPAVGSQEWHQLRKDNHKEVERRRRETINEGINELSKIVPGCEKNKGSILQRAVAYIMQLKEQEQQNLEKYTLEKLLTEQALTELSSSNEKLKAECERLYRELETWKRVAKNAGVQPPIPKEEASSGSPPPNPTD